MSKAMDVLEELAAQDLEYRTSMKEVVGCLVAAFDGGPGFARHVKLEFDAAPPGSTVRTKILTVMLELMKDSDEPEDEWEPEDYEAMNAVMSGGGNGTT